MIWAGLIHLNIFINYLISKFFSEKIQFFRLKKSLIDWCHFKMRFTQQSRNKNCSMLDLEPFIWSHFAKNHQIIEISEENYVFFCFFLRPCLYIENSPFNILYFSILFNLLLANLCFANLVSTVLGTHTYIIFISSSFNLNRIFLNQN